MKSSYTHTGEHASQSVSTTGAGLVKSTLGAGAVAGAILAFIWLPAEYGIDPTGVGRVLGLTQMGQIKAQLSAEATADQQAVLGTETALTVTRDDQLNQRLAAIDMKLSEVAKTVESISTAFAQSGTAATATVVPEESVVAKPSVTAWSHEVSHTLKSGQGIEVKLLMEQGAVAEFEWTANGSVLNYDTHGDGSGQNISYEKGRAVPEQSGELTAAFSGKHGWFWRNRTQEDVVMTLRTRGDYAELLSP